MRWQVIKRDGRWQVLSLVYTGVGNQWWCTHRIPYPSWREALAVALWNAHTARQTQHARQQLHDLEN